MDAIWARQLQEHFSIHYWLTNKYTCQKSDTKDTISHPQHLEPNHQQSKQLNSNSLSLLVAMLAKYLPSYKWLNGVWTLSFVCGVYFILMFYFLNLSVARSQTLHSIYFKSELVETIKVFKPVLKSGHTLCAPALWCTFTSVKDTAISTCLVWRP